MHVRLSKCRYEHERHLAVAGISLWATRLRVVVDDKDVLASSLNWSVTAVWRVLVVGKRGKRFERGDDFSLTHECIKALAGSRYQTDRNVLGLTIGD